ncbi:recombinase family protein [Peribacillus frigoritolerans]|uniref:recombinase family protein n=1 Tax=Peribacillus frigoritolerans TaxID=450367 RepID=UPI0010715998|nr:recombinase family protein [Peribacillus frigoritolerans]TFH61193.1 recombinase family protein [Peribacillus frigoritolerans]
MNTVAYYRNSISADKQKLSIDMQMHHVREAALNNHLLIENEFIDRATSARKTQIEERSGMKLLLEAIKKGRVKNLIVYSRCRLARNVQQYMSLFELLKQYDVNVIFAASFEVPMTYTMESELIERILAAMNQEDVDKLVQKLQDSKITVAKDGKHAGGAIPFGFKKSLEEVEKGIKKSEWKKVDQEIKDIEEIYQLFLDEDFTSLQMFVDLTNEKGKRFRNDKEWTYAGMKKVLTNPIYNGQRIYRTTEGEIKRKVSYLQIIDDEIWQQVQIKMNDLITKRERPKDVYETYLLKNLVYCSECNQMMSGRSHQLKGVSFFVYKCQRHSKVRAPKEWLEMEVLKKANEFFKNMLESNFSKIIEKIYNGEIAAYSEAVKDIEQDLKRLEDLMVERTEQALERGEALHLDDAIKNELKQFEQNQFIISELTSKILEIKEKFKTIDDWKLGSLMNIIADDLNDEEKQELLEDIVYQIEISQERVLIIFHHPLFTGITGREEFGLI